MGRTVAGTRNVTKAAEPCNVTRRALTPAITMLEQELESDQL
jgi:DNA-binding transcriptional LysR family regulator